MAIATFIQNILKVRSRYVGRIAIRRVEADERDALLAGI